MYTKFKKIILFYFLTYHQVYTQEYDFKYREPYFPEINTLEFSNKFKTNRLDDTWGIWGHNLPNIVQQYHHTDDIYATINNQKNPNQFCFSSASLAAILEKEITRLGAEKYLISPNDNQLSCQSDACKSLGNTKTNASPSVFTCLNSLAKKFPKKDFYTITYASVKEIPKFDLEKNIGIFYSTINYQEGVPFETLKKSDELKINVRKWKQKVSNIIIWDYLLNYDNYHEFYPALLVIQKNLKFYKALQIDGVFFNGSETYAVFQELKATMVAKLLMDTSINLEQEINTYFYKKYPKKIAKIIAPFYLTIENIFLTSTQKQGIYSNVEAAKKKYLNIDTFLAFYDQLTKAAKQLKKPSLLTNKLLVSILFLKLEFIRTEGIDSIEKSSKTDILETLKTLNQLLKETEIQYINETKYTFSSYISQWYKHLSKKDFTNKIQGKTLNATSKLDEDYTKPQILTDGKFGFLDYQTNWFIVSTDDLAFNFKVEEINAKDQLIFRFLNDPKHHIYFPESIQININGQQFSKSLLFDQGNLIIKEAKIKFEETIKNAHISVHISRKINTHKSALACDEIILKSSE